MICKPHRQDREITGFEHVALGTDFDGFIKPTMTGLDKVTDLKKLEDALKDKYKADAERITSGERAPRPPPALAAERLGSGPLEGTVDAAGSPAARASSRRCSS